MRRFQEMDYWALICIANAQHPEMLHYVQRSCPWSQKWINNPAGTGSNKGNTWGEVTQMPQESVWAPHSFQVPVPMFQQAPYSWDPLVPAAGDQPLVCGAQREAVRQLQGPCEGLLAMDAQHNSNVWGAPSPAQTPGSVVISPPCGPQPSHHHWTPIALILTLKSLSLRRQRNTQVSCTTFSPPSKHPEQRTRQISGVEVPSVREIINENGRLARKFLHKQKYPLLRSSSLTSAFHEKRYPVVFVKYRWLIGSCFKTPCILQDQYGLWLNRYLGKQSVSLMSIYFNEIQLVDGPPHHCISEQFWHCHDHWKSAAGLVFGILGASTMIAQILQQ